MENNQLNAHDSAQLAPETVNQPILGRPLHRRLHGHVSPDADDIVAYASQGLLRKMVNAIQYLLGNQRFAKPFSLRQWD